VAFSRIDEMFHFVDGFAEGGPLPGSFGPLHSCNREVFKSR
jgi:hypothetical protein